MLNKLSFNLMNELNRSETETFEIKKKVIVESNKITIKENQIEDAKKDSISKGLYSEGSVCEKCGKNPCECETLNEDTDKEERLASLKTQLEKDGDQLADDEKEAIEKEIAELEKEVIKESSNPEADEKVGGDYNEFIEELQNFRQLMVDQVDVQSTKLASEIIMNTIEKYDDIIRNYERQKDIEIEGAMNEDEDLTEAEEVSVKNLQVIKEQGNIFMLEDENKQIIVGENYNSAEGLIENAEIYENKDDADKDYLNRCDIIKDGEEFNPEEDSDDSEDSMNEADLGNNTYSDEDEAEYYRNKELYANSNLARHKEAMEKAKAACESKGIKVD